MELDNKNASIKTLFEACSVLINQYGLHQTDGPVNLQPIIDDLNIEVDFLPLTNGHHGYSITDQKYNIPPQIVINSLDSLEVQAEALAHEIIHLFKHAHERLHNWWDGIADSAQETEALQGAAILKVPLGYLLEMAREGHTPEVIAAELKVRKELVEIRWRMAVEFDELKDIFDDVISSKNTTETTQNNILTFNPDSKEITNSEVEILGKAVQRLQIKTPIGEVRPYRSEIIRGEFSDGVTYEIDDPVRLAWWNSLTRDYNEEELNEG